MVVTPFDHDANFRPWVLAAEGIASIVRWVPLTAPPAHSTRRTSPGRSASGTLGRSWPRASRSPTLVHPASSSSKTRRPYPLLREFRSDAHQDAATDTSQ